MYTCIHTMYEKIYIDIFIYMYIHITCIYYTYIDTCTCTHTHTHIIHSYDNPIWGRDFSQLRWSCSPRFSSWSFDCVRVWWEKCPLRLDVFVGFWGFIQMKWDLRGIFNSVYITGWWFGTFFIFPYIGNVIIPTEFHIFQRGRYTTNQIIYRIDMVDLYGRDGVSPTVGI